MSYRLQRKQFRCLPCNRVWNQLVAGDVTQVKCDDCSNQSQVQEQGNPQQIGKRPPIQIEETKESAGNRRREFQNGAYRMVFSKAQGTSHNRTNIRDTSVEPSNLYGDANINRTAVDDDEPPPLESVNNLRRASKQNSKAQNQAQRKQVPEAQNTFVLGRESTRQQQPTQQPGLQVPNLSNQARPPSNLMTTQVRYTRPSSAIRPATNQQTMTSSAANPQFHQPVSSQATNQQPTMNQQTPTQIPISTQSSSQQPPSQQDQPRQNNFQRSSLGRAGLEGVRARSTTVRLANGDTIQIVNIGVPLGHPLADPQSMAGLSGLQNVQIGGIPMPAPQFMYMQRGSQEQTGSHIESLVNGFLRSFMDLFTSHEFLRMQNSYEGFDPSGFMQNFQQSFDPEALFEIVRRMSEQEAQSKKKKAKTEAVKKLPIVKIEKKHCKNQGLKLEPPSCTVCCDSINVGTQGMFMPCGHIYHPDCLNPWLENQNTCPVCRFELPLEDP